MAIDTRNKRFSLLGLALASISVLPTPDSGIDTEAERVQYLWLYSGIATVSVPASVTLTGVALGTPGTLAAVASTHGSLAGATLGVQGQLSAIVLIPN